MFGGGPNETIERLNIQEAGYPLGSSLNPEWYDWDIFTIENA